MRGRVELAGAAVAAVMVAAGCSQTIDGDAQRAVQSMNPGVLPDLCSITGQLAQLSQDRVN